MGDNGWVRLDNTVSGISYGLEALSYDPQTDTPAGTSASWGALKGWAWGGFKDASLPAASNQDQVGVGWLSVNCSNTNTCGTSNYYLSGQPNRPFLNGVIPADGNNSSALSLIWSSAVANNSFYKIYRREGHCSNDNSLICDNNTHCSGGTCVLSTTYQVVKNQSSAEIIVDKNLTTYSDGTPVPPKNALTKNRTYYYRVAACNLFGCNLSAEKSNTTSPIDNIYGFFLNAVCFDPNNQNQSLADLFWREASIDASSGVNVASYDLEHCVLAAGKTVADCTNWTGTGISAIAKKCFGGTNAGQACVNETTCGGGLCGISYRDTITNNTDRYMYHIYRVRAVGDDGASKKICKGTGGLPCTLEGASCTTDAQCVSTYVCDAGFCSNGGNQACATNADCNIAGTCTPNPSKSAWVYSQPIRPCGDNAQYQEQRPQ
jgi:hypothetical protein